MAGKSKKFKFESVLSQRKADVVEKNLGPIVPLPDWMTKKISQHLGGTGLVGLCGAPGSGKKTILRQASSVPVQEYTVDRSLSIYHLSEFKRALQPFTNTVRTPIAKLFDPHSHFGSNMLV